ncbi:MAG: ATP-grasp domain-containing protein [Deltaproteobacteria bacterium]|nr:ATP-grasp domain-containing protein [Deltaproteobacteria bacterium]
MASKRRVNLVLTCVGSPLAWEMIQSFAGLDSPDVRIIGVDMNSAAIGRHFLQVFHEVPSGEDPEYVDILLDICRRENVHLVIPGSDEEAFTLSRSIERFRNEGIVCTVPRADLIDPMADKFLMYETLKPLGIPVPRYYRVNCPADLEDAAAELGYPRKPFVLKISSGRGGRGIWKVTRGDSGEDYFFGRSGTFREISLEEIARILDQKEGTPPLIAMEHLEGHFYDIDVLSNEGELLYGVVRRRINPLGIPFRGNVFEKNPAILSLAEEIQRALRLTYLYDLDMAYHPGKGAVLMEVNPRPSGSIVATVKAGLNLFEFLMRMAMGWEVPRVEVPAGITILPKISLFQA